MLDPRWMKIVRDLWVNRTRTILVVSSIAVGIFAVGTVQHLQTVLRQELQNIYEASGASQATIFAPGMDEAMLESIRRTPTIERAEGRSTVVVKVQLAPGRWENFTLTAIEDFDQIEIDKLIPITETDKHPEFRPELTRWPAKNEVLIENSSLDASDVLPEGIAVNTNIIVETADGRIRELTVSGMAYDANAFPAAFVGAGAGYVDFETFEKLGGERTYASVGLIVKGTPAQLADKAYIESIANDIGDKVDDAGYSVNFVRVPEPGQLGLQDLFDSIALLLTPLGLLALFLSSFLVINTISALMAQQTRQIGIMKSIGALRAQIVAMYLSAVLTYSLVAIAIAVPLTMLVAGALGKAIGGFLNLSVPLFVLPRQVLVVQIAVGILTPLLTALVPVLRGTNVTVREAISDYGVNSSAGSTDRLGRFLSKLRGMSRPAQISLRNTFRRRARLIMTLITLVMGGMIFMTVGSVRLSLTNLIEQGISYNQFDIQFEFERTYRTTKIEQAIYSVPGVSTVEIWTQGSGTPVDENGEEGDAINLVALPAASVMVQPTLLEGRWLLPDDENAIVISQRVLVDQPELKVGDDINLEIGGREKFWRVVGLAQVLSGPPNFVPAYVNYPYYARFTRIVGQGDSAQILIQDKEPAAVEAKLEEIQAVLDAEGIRVASVFTIERLRRITGGFFDVIVFMLLAMGILIASVGALGLMGTMSTNVLERTREIGVMRAIGASDGAVQRIVIVEGILIGLISWMIGGALAFPAGLALSSAVGNVLFQTALPYSFSSSGVFTWLAIVVVLATIASFLPAWNASRLTVREVLAYE